jgi:hypothetical protein
MQLADEAVFTAPYAELEFVPVRAYPSITGLFAYVVLE